MTLLDTSVGILSALSASWASTQIAMPNHSFTPPANGYWIRPVIKVPNTQVEELNDGVGLRDGLLMISVFGPQNAGTLKVNRFADRLEAFFRRKEIDDLWFDEPSSDPKGVDQNGFYHVLMTVDFHCFVGE